MHHFTQVIVALSAVSFAGILARIARVKRLAADGLRLYSDVEELVSYVDRARRGGWTKQEGEKAGALAVNVRNDVADFITAARKLI